LDVGLGVDTVLVRLAVRRLLRGGRRRMAEEMLALVNALV
jgi:hypothetical protein